MSPSLLLVFSYLLLLPIIPLYAVTITWTLPSNFSDKYTVAMVYVSPENVQNEQKAQVSYSGGKPSLDFKNVSESYEESKKISGGQTVTTTVSSYHDTGWWCAVVESNTGKTFDFYHMSITAQELAEANGVFTLDYTTLTTGDHHAVALKNGAFTDLLAAPEPTAAILLLLGGVCFALRRSV